ncbi:hypothetical protein A2U01_0057550, partial [Trifolium medium]|nr:hypothetical protein [Trifolium medium]
SVMIDSEENFARDREMKGSEMVVVGDKNENE